MKFRFFIIHANRPEIGETELNRFCGSRRIVSIEREFVSFGSDSFWSFCVQYVDGNETSQIPKKEKIDYKEVLSEKDDPGNRDNNLGFRLSRARQGRMTYLTSLLSSPPMFDSVPTLAAKTKRLPGMSVAGAERRRTLAGKLFFWSKR
jgi:hypothetical protein